MKVFKSIAVFFRAKYVNCVGFFTGVLMLLVNKMMRHLIVLNGKDPDFVSPPSAPATIPKEYTAIDEEKINKTLDKFHQTIRPSWIKNESWIKEGNLSQHPILRTRAASSSPFNGRSDLKITSTVLEPHPVGLTKEEADELLNLLTNAKVDPVWEKAIKNYKPEDDKGDK